MSTVGPASRIGVTRGRDRKTSRGGRPPSPAISLISIEATAAQ